MMGTKVPRRPAQKRERTLPDKQERQKKIVQGTSTPHRRVEPGETEPWVKSFTSTGGRKKNFEKPRKKRYWHGTTDKHTGKF